MKRTLLSVPLVLALGCGDPVHDAAVDALGPEVEGVEEGPLHRPGQPCLVCHGGDGPGEPEFSFAGTVFQGPDSRIPSVGASVQVTGQNLRSATAVTNCAGNFFVTSDDFRVVFPAITTVTGSAPAVMQTLMHRSADCSGCHRGNPGPDSPGAVWATPDATPPWCSGR